MEQRFQQCFERVGQGVHFSWGVVCPVSIDQEQRFLNRRARCLEEFLGQLTCGRYVIHMPPLAPSGTGLDAPLRSGSTRLLGGHRHNPLPVTPVRGLSRIIPGQSPAAQSVIPPSCGDATLPTALLTTPASHPSRPVKETRGAAGTPPASRWRAAGTDQAADIFAFL